MIKICNYDHPDSLSVIILLEELSMKYKLVSFENLIESRKSPECPLLQSDKSTPLMIDVLKGTNEQVELSGSGAIMIYLAEKMTR